MAGAESPPFTQGSTIQMRSVAVTTVVATARAGKQSAARREAYMMVGNRMYLLLQHSEMEASTYTSLLAGYRHQVTLITSKISMMDADRCLMVAETPLDSRQDAIMVERMMSKELEKCRSSTELHV
jgi:hypothetical protein